MSITTHHLLAVLAIAALAFHLGKRSAAAVPKGPTNHGEIEQSSDWWSYAGSWA